MEPGVEARSPESESGAWLLPSGTASFAFAAVFVSDIPAKIKDRNSYKKGLTEFEIGGKLIRLSHDRAKKQLDFREKSQDNLKKV